MPKLEIKAAQKELEAGKAWPFYWIYGPERMKSRELIKRIRAAVLGEEQANSGFSGFLEEVLEGSEVSAESILDSARTLSFGGGTRLVLVRDAHAVKDPEPLSELLGPPLPLSELPAVVICLSKDLDGRKKFSKLLTEKAAVVECSDIEEQDREAWIGFLAKRRGMNVSESLGAYLRSLDPWSLDIADQELEKAQLSGSAPGAESAEADFAGVGSSQGSEAFFEAFFGRHLQRSLEITPHFADRPEESLPLLGLFTWNVRQLSLVVADREKGTRSAKLPPFLADRFKRWSRNWQGEELLVLQSYLQQIDFGLKQTPRLPLGLWGDLIVQFCPGSPS
jgi:DNA polymerase-3 subunit delta